MLSEEYDYLYKIVLVGDAGVGKTHILCQYIMGTSPLSYAPTVGVEFATRNITLPAGGTVKAQIWDTAGQEKYRAITSAHYKRAVGALLVYDITKTATFYNVSQWMDDIREHAGTDIVIMLVGNKTDIVAANPNLRRVSQNIARQFAAQNNCLFEETSALKNSRVAESFENLLQKIHTERFRVDEHMLDMSDPIALGEQPTQKTCCK